MNLSRKREPDYQYGFDPEKPDTTWDQLSKIPQYQWNDYNIDWTYHLSKRLKIQGMILVVVCLIMVPVMIAALLSGHNPLLYGGCLAIFLGIGGTMSYWLWKDW